LDLFCPACRWRILTLFLVGTLRCGVQRRVQRRNKRNRTSFHACSARSARAGTSQRDVPAKNSVAPLPLTFKVARVFHLTIEDIFESNGE